MRMSYDRYVYSLGLCLALLAIPAHRAGATYSALAIYQEMEIGGGFWEYDYTLFNQADPILEAGWDVYDFYLSIPVSIPISISSFSSPPDWSFITDQSTFIDWHSDLIGEPPEGADLPPGALFSGFKFLSDTRLTVPLSFEVLFANPDLTGDPVIFTGTTSPSQVPDSGRPGLSLWMLLVSTLTLVWARERRLAAMWPIRKEVFMRCSVSSGHDAYAEKNGRK